MSAFLKLTVLVSILGLLAPFPLLASDINSPNRNTSITSFNKAKKLLLNEVYIDQDKTFYCGSTFNREKQVTHTRGYQPRKESKRAYRLEWEHVVPAHAFGQSFPEWREGHPDCVDSKGRSFKGRRCAEKVNIEFRYMQADMHNLVPAIGELNGLRSNYSFAIISGEARAFGVCDMEIENRKAEPPPKVRGDIARTYFYMDAAYPGRGIVSNKNRKLFDAWDKQDPVDVWECERAFRIGRVQGNENPYVEQVCQ